MDQTKRARRDQWLEQMSKEAVACYVDPYGEWDEDEKEFLPRFLSLAGERSQILDLAGGNGKASKALLSGGNSVLVADLSLASLRRGRHELGSEGVQFMIVDMNGNLPFTDKAFDAIWFAQAFEYVPPDRRLSFLRSLRRIMKDKGVVFFSAEGLRTTRECLSYLKGYLYWRIVKRAPIVWGECVYWLDLPLYEGWHYHSLVLNRGIEKDLEAAGFDVIDSRTPGRGEYYTYILRAV